MVSRGIKVVIVALVVMYTCEVISSDLHPLIFVPGLAGSPIDARLTDDYVPSSLCAITTQDWFRLWLNLTDPLELISKLQCLVDRLSIYYNATLDDYQNAVGVETRVPGFGSPDIGPFVPDYETNPLVKLLENIGYVANETLFGAPYDFRYGLAEVGHPSHVGSKFLQDLKDLIENASVSNGGKSVILVSHSLGGLYVLQFLNRVSLSWRQNYIKHFVPMSTPWAGSVHTMRIFAGGTNYGVPLIDLALRAVARNLETTLWLMPTPGVFGLEKALVTTQNATYSAYDVSQLMSDVGFPQAIDPYETRILPLAERLTPPLVPVTFITGTGVNTAEMCSYGEGGFDEQPNITYGDGDGTVNLASLLAINNSEWLNNTNQVLKIITLDGINHTAILQEGAVIQEICTINNLTGCPLPSVLADKASALYIRSM